MVVLKNNKMSTAPIADVAGKMRVVTGDCSLVKTALSLGICLGFPEGADPANHYQNPVPSNQAYPIEACSGNGNGELGSSE
jgi:hypothetical protein